MRKCHSRGKYALNMYIVNKQYGYIVIATLLLNNNQKKRGNVNFRNDIDVLEIVENSCYPGQVLTSYTSVAEIHGP